MKIVLLISITVIATLEATVINNEVELTAENRALLVWTGADFIFVNQTVKENAISKGKYIKENVIATRFQFWKNHVLAVYPRYRDGVPATVAYTEAYINKRAPLWIPFPSWSAQNINEKTLNEMIINAVDIFIDSKNRAWVLDSGTTNSLQVPCRYSPPKVLVISLITNKILRVIDLSYLTCNESQVQFLAVEATEKGHTYVYVGDAATSSILVWDVHRSRGWRVQLPTFVLDTNLALNDVMYISLVHRPDSNSILYITYLSSSRMFSMRTEFLRRGFSTQGRLVDQGIKPAKMIILGVDGGTSIFFRYEDQSEIYRWDTKKDLKIENFVKVYNGQNYGRFATHVAPDYNRNEMMVLESNYPDFIAGYVGYGTSHTIGPLIL